MFPVARLRATRGQKRGYSEGVFFLKKPFKKADELFRNKLARKQFAGYLQSKSLRRMLFETCLQEAVAAQVLDGRNAAFSSLQRG